MTMRIKATHAHICITYIEKRVIAGVHYNTLLKLNLTKPFTCVYVLRYGL